MQGKSVRSFPDWNLSNAKGMFIAPASKLYAVVLLLSLFIRLHASHIGRSVPVPASSLSFPRLDSATRTEPRGGPRGVPPARIAVAVASMTIDAFVKQAPLE